jgi:deoxyhypusine monooxygenase
MFSLRNRGGEDSVHQLGRALTTDTSSALLRHEVAYVLGQMQHPSSVEYLIDSLKRRGEHKMVRHESAEALGAIEERWGECEEVLKQFLEDEDPVVRESCVVALDAADYFGYANRNSNEDESGERVNFSLHKAEVERKGDGVLHNHFNIAA